MVLAGKEFAFIPLRIGQKNMAQRLVLALDKSQLCKR